MHYVDKVLVKQQVQKSSCCSLTFVFPVVLKQNLMGTKMLGKGMKVYLDIHLKSYKGGKVEDVESFQTRSRLEFWM